MAKADLIARLAELGVTTSEVSEKVAAAGITPITGDETNTVLEDLIKKVEALPASSEEGDDANKPPEPDGQVAPPASAAPAAPVVPATPTAPAPSPKAPKEADYGDSVDVVAKGDVYIRTFSEEVHGSDFLELAKTLVAKNEYAKREYRLVPSSEVTVLEVRYREKEDAEKSIDDQKPDSPMVDKRRRFEDRDAALAFNVEKKGTIVVVR